MINLESSKQYFSWDMFEHPSMDHIMQKIQQKCNKHPLHIERLSPTAKYLWIAGKKGIIFVPYIGDVK